MQDVAANYDKRNAARARRMVSASSNAPALDADGAIARVFTEQSTLCQQFHRAGGVVATTMISGRMALSVMAVSISVSPF